ncbi:MAG: hypothetical protein LC652_06080 [Halomonas sp.]|nr:hypothetical protein [Halomonas sp.]
MRERLEHYQVFLYLAAILAGLWLGTSSPAFASGLDAALWPLLGLLLYATFTQVPMIRLRRGLAQGRFLTAAVLGNFVVIPLVVWGLVQWLPPPSACCCSWSCYPFTCGCSWIRRPWPACFSANC